MRRIPFIAFVFVLFSFSLVSAGERYTVDFTEVRSQAVYLYEDDEVRFQLLGDEHVIIIEEVGTSSIKVDIGPFLSTNKELSPGLIGLDYIMKLDLDRDGSTDLNVALYSVSAEGQVHLVLQDATQIDEEITGDVGVVDSAEGLSSKTLALIVIGVLLLGLVIFFVFRNNGFFDESASQEGFVPPEHTKSEGTKASEAEDAKSNVEEP